MRVEQWKFVSVSIVRQQSFDIWGEWGAGVSKKNWGVLPLDENLF